MDSAGDAVWAPDGERIAFFRARVAKQVCGSGMPERMGWNGWDSVLARPFFGF